MTFTQNKIYGVTPNIYQVEHPSDTENLVQKSIGWINLRLSGYNRIANADFVCVGERDMITGKKKYVLYVR